MYMLVMHQAVDDKDFYYIYNYNETMHYYMKFIDEKNIDQIIENIRNNIMDLLRTRNQYLVITYNDGIRLILDQTKALKFLTEDIRNRYLNRK